MESHRRGELTEAIVVAELKRREIPVAKPTGDNERYDLIAESEAGLWRLQVKTGRVSDGTIRFHGKSQHTNAQGNVYEPYDGDVDYFVVYAHELETMYLVAESAFRTDMRLRIEEPSQPDRTINWAEDYEFDRNWPPEDGTARPTNSDDTFVERLAEYEVSTYLTSDDEQPHDALAETPNGDLYRLQFELGWVVDGRIRFDATGSASQGGDPPDVEYVVVFCAELDQLYLVDRDSFDSTITLRVEEPEQPNARINWAADYEFGDNWPP